VQSDVWQSRRTRAVGRHSRLNLPRFANAAMRTFFPPSKLQSQSVSSANSLVIIDFCRVNPHFNFAASKVAASMIPCADIVHAASSRDATVEPTSAEFRKLQRAFGERNHFTRVCHACLPCKHWVSRLRHNLCISGFHALDANLHRAAQDLIRREHSGDRRGVSETISARSRFRPCWTCRCRVFDVKKHRWRESFWRDD